MEKRKVLRHFTEDEIASIVAAVPRPIGSGVSNVELAWQHFRSLLADGLRERQIVDNPAAIQALKEQIVERCYQAMVENGHPVGVLAAMGMGAPITQILLDTKRSAGSESGTATSFVRIRDIITGSKSDRNSSMVVFFKEPKSGSTLDNALHVGTEEEIYANRGKYVETTVANLVVDQTIIDYEQATTLDLKNLLKLFVKLRPDRFNNVDNRYHLNRVLVLTLDSYRMYSYNITMYDVARAIEGPSPVNSVTCIWKSQFESTIYVLVDETHPFGFGFVDERVSMTMFFQTQIQANLKNWMVKGIPSIVGVEPLLIEVLDVIGRITPKDSQRYIIEISPRKTRLRGASLADLERLLRTMPIEIVETVPGGFLVQDNVSIGETAYRKRLQEFVNAVDKIPDDKRSEQEKLRLKYATFYAMKTSGSNFDALLWRDDIDLYRTYSNNPHTINKELGINSALVLLIEEFVSILESVSSAGSIDMRHIQTVFYMMTNLGVINSMGFSGIHRKRAGPMASSTSNRAMQALIGGVSGVREKLNSISTSTALGQRNRINGTGLTGYEIDDTMVPAELPSSGVINDLPEVEFEIPEVVGGFGALKEAEITLGMEALTIEEPKTLITSSPPPAKDLPLTIIVDLPEPQSLEPILLPRPSSALNYGTLSGEYQRWKALVNSDFDPTFIDPYLINLDLHDPQTIPKLYSRLGGLVAEELINKSRMFPASLPLQFSDLNGKITYGEFSLDNIQGSYLAQGPEEIQTRFRDWLRLVQPEYILASFFHHAFSSLFALDYGKLAKEGFVLEANGHPFTGARQITSFYPGDHLLNSVGNYFDVKMPDRFILRLPEDEELQDRILEKAETDSLKSLIYVVSDRDLSSSRNFLGVGQGYSLLGPDRGDVQALLMRLPNI